MKGTGFLLGVVAATAGRTALLKLVGQKLSSDIKKLNAGDHRPLLKGYADDFVLHFHEGPHRWSGDWIGIAGVDRFLRNFVAAKVQGEVRDFAASGPLWALTLWVRFDDHATAPDGTLIYENSTVLVLRTRLGKVVEQFGYFVDSDRITALDQRLMDMGVEAIPKV